NSVMVTPESKGVGEKSLAMVSANLTRADDENPDKEIAFPDSVVGFFAGDLGQPVGGFPEKLQNKVLKGKAPMTGRPGSYLAPADLGAERDKARAAADMEIDDARLASYLMYPKVFVEFAKAQELYGPTEVLPTPVYFYGLAPADEIMVDLEKGKTMVVQFLGQSEANEKGMVRVFFDLNGQPRSVSVPDRLKAGEIVVRRKATQGDPKQIGAPMPGVISTLAVQAGQKIEAGDVLLSIEAMKMETALHAEVAGVVAEVLVRPGDQIDAKDLLIRIE